MSIRDGVSCLWAGFENLRHRVTGILRVGSPMEARYFGSLNRIPYKLFKCHKLLYIYIYTFSGNYSTTGTYFKEHFSMQSYDLNFVGFNGFVEQNA